MSDYLDINNEELLKDFFSEAEQQVETLESNILVIEQTPNDHNAIDEIFRAAHTLKGGSATVEMTELSQFTHAMEDLLDAIRSGFVEVTGKGNFVADLGFVHGNPGIGRMRQHFAREKGFYAAWLLERYLFVVTQFAIGFVLHHVAPVIIGFEVSAVIARLEVFAFCQFSTPGNDRLRVFVAPAHRFVDGFFVSRADFFALRLHGTIEACAEGVVVIKNAIAQYFLCQPR